MRLTVNSAPVQLSLDGSTPLVYVLRNDLGLRAVRAGCGIGECGACVVLVDGRPTRSCQTPLSAVEGRDVVTPEGLGSAEDPHPVQRAFLDEQAAQCGYCVNGIVMTMAGLLRDEPAPDDAAIRAALGEHLCRCGTHHRILRAARRAAGRPDPPGGAPLPAPVAGDPDGDRTLPAALGRAPLVEQWLRPLPDGRVEVRSGRVELGQGVRTALAQIVAAGLGVPTSQVVVRSAATDATPDEGYTAGSTSLEQGGAALAAAARAYRRLQAAGQPPAGPITAGDIPQWTEAPLGEGVARTDLPTKLTGPAYVHDLLPPGTVHARAVLPPSYDARLVALDVDAVRTMPGVLATVHDGRLVLVVAEREEQAVRAAARLARTATWDDPGLAPDASHPEPATGLRIAARYAKPYEAHAAVAPSCAVALVAPDTTTVWTHSQGVYPLRRELCALLGVGEDRVTVRHVDGPGCYGHNGADDAAGFAVYAARAVAGRPVRFQFSVSDEFGWEPYGPAMVVDLAATIDHSGRIVAWRHRGRTGPHTSRPHGSGDRLAAAWLRAGGPPRPWTGGGEGGARNAEPIYDLPDRQIDVEYVPAPLRTSALRSLGAYANVFAIESFVDELAEAAGLDPVAFRLAHLRDERAVAVLRAATDAAGWRTRVGPSGGGQGVALARYRSAKAYVAQVCEAAVDPATGAIRVHRVVTACDAGTVVNPDGLRNQLEGGVLQGLSRALYEQVRYDRHGVTSRDWTSYPVLGFADVPVLETILLDRPGWPPLGAGEAATPVTPAALANAVDDAVGLRVRTLPLTPQRLRDRVAELDDAEQRRVRS